PSLEVAARDAGTTAARWRTRTTERRTRLGGCQRGRPWMLSPSGTGVADRVVAAGDDREGAGRGDVVDVERRPDDGHVVAAAHLLDGFQLGRLQGLQEGVYTGQPRGGARAVPR